MFRVGFTAQHAGISMSKIGELAPKSHLPDGGDDLQAVR